MSQHILVIIPKTKKTLTWTLGLGLAAALVAGIFINPPKAQSQAASGGNCRVGIAVDRSGSVANRNIYNPYFAKQQLKSIMNQNSGNHINNPNIELSFWTFGTGASGFTGKTTSGHQLDGSAATSGDYPFYQVGSGTRWINTATSNTTLINRWNSTVDAIPFRIGAAALRVEDWTITQNNNTPNGPNPKYPVNVGPFNFLPGAGPVHHPLSLSTPENYVYYPYGGPANTRQLRLVKDLSGNVVTGGSSQNFFYGREGYYRLLTGDNGETDARTELPFKAVDPANGTNWEAGLGRNQSGFLPNWNMSQGAPIRASESDIIVLLTDAIESELSTNWFNNVENSEPNFPSNGWSRALAAANYWRSPAGGNKEIVVVSFAGKAGESSRYHQLSGSPSNVITLEEDRLNELGQRLVNIAETKCAKFAAKPYLKVYGNDARAGGEFGNQFAVCDSSSAPKKANVRTFIRPRNSSDEPWAGAGVQHALSATGEVSEFFSAGRRNGLSGQPKPPNDLTFGNFNDSRIAGFSPPPGDSGMDRCIPDYFESALANGVTKNQGVSPSSAVHTIEGFSIANNTSRVDIIDAKDVHVGSNTNPNITYDSTSWSSVSQIPSYTLIVKGHDIYIDDSTTRLTGTYIALPDEKGQGGRIFTCSASGRSVPSPDNMKQQCSNRLTIDGAFIARQVRFHRTTGDVKTAAANEPVGSDNVAEFFNFGQETYLAPPASLRRGAAGTRYDSIVSLPPVL